MMPIPRHRADYGWLAIAVGVVVYDLLSGKENSLSTAMDTYLECHPWLARGVVVTTAMHLLGLIPRQVDPFHQMLVLIERKRMLGEWPALPPALIVALRLRTKQRERKLIVDCPEIAVPVFEGYEVNGRA